MHSSQPQLGAKAAAPTRLPEDPIGRWMRPFVRFLNVESASGVVLLICTMVALVLANSPLGGAYADFWKSHVRVSLGTLELDLSLLHWVNDGLMTIFFFVVGLEIKREVVAGELRDSRKAALPVMAALGGMVAPATIYLLLQNGQPGQSGWGIPMATDIAFVVGFLALLGPRVPLGLKILLLSLAIADDIGAVLVIACFYSTNISFAALSLAVLGFGLIYLLNRSGFRVVPVYAIIGAGVWLAFLKSGVHPTVAGVLLGLLTPARPWVGDKALVDVLTDVLHRLRDEKDGQIEHYHLPQLRRLETASREAFSPLERLESSLHPWVAFGIMPIFALANAGFRVEPAEVGHPIALAVAAALVIGKPLGIVLFSFIAVRVGLARLPAGVNWRVMLGAGCLSGIGFTMSLFIADLALDVESLDAGKIGTLTGSALSAVLGSLLLLAFLPRRSEARKGLKTSTVNNPQQTTSVEPAHVD